VRPEQTVEEMAEEVLVRQAKTLVDRTGQSFETSLESVAETQAGRQLRELANSAYSEQRAADWQDSLPWPRAEEHHYSWLESYMEWLEGKEVRTEYHAVVEEELASLASLRG
jgi:hypothetical protein